MDHVLEVKVGPFGIKVPDLLTLLEQTADLLGIAIKIIVAVTVAVGMVLGAFGLVGYLLLPIL